MAEGEGDTGRVPRELLELVETAIVSFEVFETDES